MSEQALAPATPNAAPVIRFPREADLIHEQARSYRRKSPAERFDALFSLIAFNLDFVARSPHRARGRRARQEQEQAWRAAQEALFRRHGP